MRIAGAITIMQNSRGRCECKTTV